MKRYSLFLFSLLLLLPLAASSQCVGEDGFGRGRNLLAGRVVDSVTQMDVPGVVVRLEGRRLRQQAMTDSQGRFLFDCIAPDTYKLEVSRDGYETERVHIDMVSGGVPDAIIRITPVKKVSLEPGGVTVSAREAQIPEQAREAFEKGVEELHRKNKPERSLKHFQYALELYSDYDEAYVQLGIAYLQVARFSEAEEILKRALRVYSRNARAHMFLGKAYYQQGLADNAVRELREALAIDNTLWAVHLDLARLRRKQGDHDGEYHHAEQAHNLYRESPDVHLFSYNACINTGRFAAALAELDEYVKLFPDTEVAKKMQAMRPQLSQKVASLPQ